MQVINLISLQLLDKFLLGQKFNILLFFQIEPYRTHSKSFINLAIFSANFEICF